MLAAKINISTENVWEKQNRIMGRRIKVSVEKS